MKKIKYLIICLIIIGCSGCVKYNIKMGINPDKSMDLKIVYAVEKTLGSKTIDNKEIKQLEKNGYTIKKYNKDSYIGYTISKKIKNIDEISTISDNVAELNITNETKYMFKNKKGLYKNEYTYIGNTLNQDNATNIDLKTMESSGMEMTLKVTLPYKVKKSNATKVSKDGKELKWNLLTMKNQKVFFMFELYNIPNIIVSVIGIIAITVIIIFIAKGKKKKDQYNGNFDIS